MLKISILTWFLVFIGAEPEILQLLLHVVVVGRIRNAKNMAFRFAALRSRGIDQSALYRYRCLNAWLSQDMKPSLRDRGCEAYGVCKGVICHVHELLLPLSLDVLLDLVYLLLMYLISTIRGLRPSSYLMWSIYSMILAPVLKRWGPAFVWDIVEWLPWYRGGFS